MPSSVSSNSTAWQTALTSARTSNVTNNSQQQQQQQQNNDTGTASSSQQRQQQQQPMSSYATMARIVQAGGYGTPSALPPPPRPPSSTASSSSSFTSEHSTSRNSYTSGDRQSYAQRSSAGLSSGGYGQRQNTSGGWRGNANVAGPDPSSAAAYGDSLSRSSTRSSSAVSPSTYANASLPRISSQSELSGSESDNNGYSSHSNRGGFSSSRSQTSVESETPEAFAARQSTLIREVVRPVQANTSEWEAAFNSISVDARKKARDEEELAAGIEALGLNPDLTEKKPSRNTASYPPPPSTGAWSFKKSIQVPRGSTVDPEKLAGPTPAYLEIACKGSEYKPLSYFVGQRPKLLVLDINQTLVTRKKATSQGARNATPRPYLSAFLEYICGSDEVKPGVFQRRFNVMIWSSAEAANVNTMCEGMSLFTESGTQAPLLVDAWDRSSMDLTLEQFHAKYPTIKDLTKIWRILKWNPLDPASPNPALIGNNGNTAQNGRMSSGAPGTSSHHSANGHFPSPSPSPAPSVASSSSTLSTASYTNKDLRWSQRDTILIDDTPSKASLQPHNHLCIPSWKPPTKTGIMPDPSGYPYGGRNGTGIPKPDTCLLQVIAMLDRLRCHTNVSAAIRGGQFVGLGRDEKGEAWAKAGVEILKAKGIRPTKDFDPIWATRVLSKTAVNANDPSTGGLGNGAASPAPAIIPGVHVGWD